MKFTPYNHTEAALNERIGLILNEEKKKGNEKEALRAIFQSIDFTTLEAFDNEAKIKEFCEKALAFPKQKTSAKARIAVKVFFIVLLFIDD